MFDTNTLSLLYLTNDVSNSRSPVISLAIKSFPDTNHLEARSDESIPPKKGILLAMTKNSYLAVLDSTNGEIISFQSTYAKESSSISMNIIGMYFIRTKEKKNVSVSFHFSTLATLKFVLVTSSFCSESDYLSPEALSVAHAPSTPKITGESYSVPANAHSGRTLHEVGADTSSGIANLFVLLCCETALYLHPLKLMNEVPSGFLTMLPPFLICFC